MTETKKAPTAAEIETMKVDAVKAYRGTIGSVVTARKALADALSAQEPAIAKVVGLCGNAVKMKDDKGNVVLAKFRKAPQAGGGYLVSHESLDGTAY